MIMAAPETRHATCSRARWPHWKAAQALSSPQAAWPQSIFFSAAFARMISFSPRMIVTAAPCVSPRRGQSAGISACGLLIRVMRKLSMQRYAKARRFC
jgi:hypothetical protein